MSNVRRKFGKELDNVLSIVKQNNPAVASNKKELKTLFVQCIVPGRYQPRKIFNETSLLELADSIKEKGFIQPIVVRSVGIDEYEIIAGERRWRAAQIAQLQQVPAIVIDIDNETTLAFSLIENIQREDLNAIEEAEAFQRLLEEFGLKHEEIAKKVGKSRSAITNSLRLLKLCKEVRDLVEEGAISAGHAKVLISLEDDKQTEVARHIIKKQLSVRETETLVQRLNKPEITSNDKSLIFQEKIKSWEKELHDLIHDTVKIKMNDKGEGSVTIRFKSEQEIEWLVDKLMS